VFLRDIWPSAAEVAEVGGRVVHGETFRRTYADVFTGDERWDALPVPGGALFDWDPESTYVRYPPYFDDVARQPGAVADLVGARCLVVLGDSVTTDHISPAGAIHPESPAGRYRLERGVAPKDFN
jgi:aconitate hydratase